jgi:hypothetical protein
MRVLGISGISNKAIVTFDRTKHEEVLEAGGVGAAR